MDASILWKKIWEDDGCVLQGHAHSEAIMASSNAVCLTGPVKSNSKTAPCAIIPGYTTVVLCASEIHGAVFLGLHT